MSEPTFDFDQPLTDDDGALDPDLLVDYALELVGLVADAPEGGPLDDDDLEDVEGVVSELVERGVREHGVRPHQLTAPILERILFEGFPQSWRHPAEARSILEALALTVRYVGRVAAMPAAAECVALLDAEATRERLAAAFRAFNQSCPDPELAAFLKEEPVDDPDGEGGPRSPPPAVRSREEQRKTKDKKKDKKKAQRRNRR